MEFPLKKKIFFDLVTLTFELDLDILPLDIHAKIQVCSVMRVRRTDRHTYPHNVKSITPFPDVWCKGIESYIDLVNTYSTCSLMTFIQGLLDDDRVLAGALWRQFFEFECEDPEHLRKLVHYVRQQVLVL